MDQLRQDVGLMIEKITHVTLMFRRVKLTMEEYVCLKVITMLNQGKRRPVVNVDVYSAVWWCFSETRR